MAKKIRLGVSERIRIMSVISRMNVGGPSVHVVTLHDYLPSNSYDSLLVTGIEGKHEGSMKDLAAERGLRLAIIPELGREISPISDLISLYRLYSLMRRVRPHVVHTHMAKAGFVGRFAARLAGVPVVVHTFHGHIFQGYFGPRKTRLILLLEQLGARLSDRLITISPRLRQELAEYGVGDSGRVEVIPLGLELDAFATRRRHDGGFRAELGLPEGTRLVAAVGRLVAIKNIPLFLAAAARVHQVAADIHFALIGDGELRPDLESRAATLGLSDVVHFTGWRRDLPPIYADLDAIVVSSDNEGTPVSLIEAMATGCPVVATRVGGIPDLVSDGESGRLVPPGDADALANAVLEVFDDPEQTNRMARAARQRTLECHQAARQARDIDRLYRRLLADKRLSMPGDTVGPETQCSDCHV